MIKKLSNIKLMRRLYFVFVIGIFLINLLINTRTIMHVIPFTIYPTMIVYAFVGIYIEYWLYFLLGWHLCFKTLFTESEVFEKRFIHSLFLAQVISACVSIPGNIFFWEYTELVNSVLQFFALNLSLFLLVFKQLKNNRKVFIKKMLLFIGIQLIISGGLHILSGVAKQNRVIIPK